MPENSSRFNFDSRVVFRIVMHDTNVRQQAMCSNPTKDLLT